MCKQADQRNTRVQRRFQRRDDSQRKKRMSPEREKVIVPRHHLCAECRCKHARDQRLHFAVRGISIGSMLSCRVRNHCRALQRCTIKLARLSQRQRGDDPDFGRNQRCRKVPLHRRPYQARDPAFGVARRRNRHERDQSLVRGTIAVNYCQAASDRRTSV